MSDARRYGPLVLAVALALTATASGSAAAQKCDDPNSQLCTYEDKINARMSDVTFVHVPGRPDPKTYLYSSSCYIENEVRTADGCIDGTIPEPPEPCETGTWAQPRWAQIRDTGDGTPGPWVLEAGYTCPGDWDFPFAYEEFTQLLIDPSPLTLEPSTGWVYAGLETVAYSDDAARGYFVELLGMPFYVGAIPMQYSWDFGDGSIPLVTTEPGQSWPDHTVSHTYTSGGTVTPVLTTSWKGVFRTNQLGSWTEIPGTGETVTTGAELTIHTARTRLVEDPLS